MDSTENKLFSKKNIITFLILGIMVLAIPLAVLFVRNTQKQTQLQSQASSTGELNFRTGENAPFQQCTGTNCTTSEKKVKIELIAPTSF